jgi:transposase
MLILPLELKAFIAAEPVHFGKSIDGLAQLVQTVLLQDPFSRHLFVFRNRTCNKVKVLYWDRNGFCLWQKRLEIGRFNFLRQENNYVIDAAELGYLLEGVDFCQTKNLPNIRYRAVC